MNEERGVWLHVTRGIEELLRAGVEAAAHVRRGLEEPASGRVYAPLWMHLAGWVGEAG